MYATCCLRWWRPPGDTYIRTQLSRKHLRACAEVATPPSPSGWSTAGPCRRPGTPSTGARRGRCGSEPPAAGAMVYRHRWSVATGDRSPPQGALAVTAALFRHPGAILAAVAHLRHLGATCAITVAPPRREIRAFACPLSAARSYVWRLRTGPSPGSRSSRAPPSCVCARCHLLACYVWSR